MVKIVDLAAGGFGSHQQKGDQMKAVLSLAVLLSMITGLAWGNDVLLQSNGLEREDGAYQLDIDLSGSLQNPAFSPDGSSIVLTRFRDGYNTGASDLFIYDLETGELKSLVADGNSNVNLPGSVWNGTIDSVVFSSDGGSHDEIFLISEAGSTGEEVRITNRVGQQSYEPAMSPDGQWIVFESHDIDEETDVEANGVITKYSIDGSSGYIELTASSDNCKQPNWSPMGNRILYQKVTNGEWAIWTMDINGRNKRMVTGLNESGTDAVFSYNGQWIVYSSENDSVDLANLYLTPAWGGVPIRITTYEGYDGAPSMSPDGSRIVFESIDTDPDASQGTAIWMVNIP